MLSEPHFNMIGINSKLSDSDYTECSMSKTMLRNVFSLSFSHKITQFKTKNNKGGSNQQKLGNDAFVSAKLQAKNNRITAGQGHVD